MKNLANVDEATQYLKGKLLVSGLTFDDRSGTSTYGELKREFLQSPEGVQAFVREALNNCLAELQDPESSWYSKDFMEPRADDLLLFANDNGHVVDATNKAKVLGLVDAVPADIDSRIQFEESKIHDRCIQTLLGLLTDDEPSKDFVAARKDKYPKEYWMSTPNHGVVGMEKFHGVKDAYDMVLEQKLDYSSLFFFACHIQTSHAKSEWHALLDAENASADTGDVRKKAILLAIELALNAGADGKFDMLKLRDAAPDPE